MVLGQLVDAGSLWLKVSMVVTFLCSLWAFYLFRCRRMVRDMDLLFAAQMEEQIRIARELHDTLLQSAQGLILSFSHFAAQLTEDSEVHADMERALQQAEELMVSCRNRIRDLR
jgi:signal transduction histidine kinase